MSPPSMCIIPKFYIMYGGKGMYNSNGSVSMGTEKILQIKKPPGPL